MAVKAGSRARPLPVRRTSTPRESWVRQALHIAVAFQLFHQRGHGGLGPAYPLGEIAHIAGFAGQKVHQNIPVAGGEIGESGFSQFRKDETVAHLAQAAGM